jgi:hypothetical protein
LSPGFLAAAERDPDSGLFRAEAPAGYDALAAVTRSAFAQQLGSTFVVARRRLLPLRLRLVEVGDALAAEEAGLLGSETSFIVVFAGPAGALLRQGIQSLRHDVLGALDIFLVPLGRPGRAQLYAAAFDRRTRA